MDTWIGIAGFLATLLGLVLAFLDYREGRKAMQRHIDLALWRRPADVFEGQIKLRNESSNRAIIDRIEVLDPKGTKIAWHPSRPDANKLFNTGSALDDPDVTNAHIVRLSVEPGEAGTVGMMMRFPRPSSEVDRVVVRCRLNPPAKRLGIFPSRWRKVELPISLAQPSIAVLKGK